MAENINERRDELRARISTNIKVFRGKLGMSQEALADRAGLHRTHISQLERGTLNLGLDTLIVVAAALGVDEVELLAVPTEIPEPVQRGPRKRSAAEARRVKETQAEVAEKKQNRKAGDKDMRRD
ncbi:helix-turn-helix domain-containing protein [Paraburkholderia youngii]|uniref:helix-turn-helix domain-containing protein n=1 Tax=Paraburkholderia youngii TaxID=2782701 RepID=UPI0020CEA56F|nr:helix-turn-helix transcriptional regulator [Paraburkholderia youngii]